LPRAQGRPLRSWQSRCRTVGIGSPAHAASRKTHMDIERMQPRAGFSLIDMMVAISVIAILVAAAVPQLVNVAESVKLGQAQRDINQELNQARLRAVSANRPIRVRFNCPAVG